MVVDAQQAPALDLSHAVAGKMDFADGGRRQRIEVGRRVPAVVVRAHEDIVDVAENAAAGARGDGGEKLPLRDGRMLELQVRRGILDENWAPQARLGLIDVPANDIERLL